MHDGHRHGSCGDCVSFVMPFATATRIAAWGYCGRQSSAPAPHLLATLEQAALAGDRSAVRKNTAGLFKPEEDDCCDLYQERR
ncbi:MAG: hypothetical protein IT304_08575 [Dehalococcoidia bacterium]|nr:hypothetical protein [Dehalococcoidia bacterium]